MTRGGLISFCYEDVVEPCEEVGASSGDRTPRSAALWRAARQGKPTCEAYARCLAWDHPTWSSTRVSQEASRLYLALHVSVPKGTVVLATRFGIITAEYFAVDLLLYGQPDVYALIRHPQWADDVRLVGGPFCEVVWDDELPF